ncbi:bifunctional diguanylate cyclase/phosphodiesterase [Rhodococcus sp. X156]|uniref:putative bifunctional diguanylate cyclase/phosphodiesterase n=1 Tax=Rhodococcus sp. X156 TaxID=2499145 RepID=UPI000FD6E2EC|nr:bifunctional diguanylate cyclase/phosphodiesterase [Rhodococcus sp. X156]
MPRWPDSASAWHRRQRRHPVIATPMVMARAFGLLFSAGGLLVSLAALVPHNQAASLGTLYVVAGVAVVVGTALLLCGDRLRRAAFNPLVSLGVLLLGVGAHTSGGGAPAISILCCNVFVAAVVFFFSRWWVVVHLLSAVASCIGVTWADGDTQRWAGLVVAAIVVIIGYLQHWLMRLADQTDVDTLTGLHNRRGFDRYLRAAVDKARLTGQPLTLALLDLDRFSLVNLTGGHAAGDAVLQTVATVLREVVGPDHAIARFGGDEFALLLGCGEEEAAAVVEQVRAALPQHACSAGVTTWQAGESASLLVGRADAGLYRAKKDGGSRVVVERTRRSPVAVELRAAVETGALDVHYQPVVDLRTGVVVGMEALARWRSSSYPGITPDQFIAIAERDDCIHALGHHVLRKSCSDAAWMQDATGVALRLNVNVSGLELMSSRYLHGVQDVLASTGWPAEQLVLEVTESVLVPDAVHAVNLLKQLRALGVRVAIDDFGTGYSSLSRLDDLPRDFLKLDRAFVSTLQRGEPVPAVLTAIAALSKALTIEVIAEGVEDDYQAETLAELGYPMAQGYYYGRPMPATELVALLGRTTSDVATPV